MKQIETLVQDIEKVLVDGLGTNSEALVQAFAENLSRTISERLIRAKREPGLRMSNIGKPCERALWYEVNGYEGEQLTASTYLKFLFGDILEDLLLFLAEVAGHEVTGRQSESEIAGIKGRKDGYIDGTLVDVKSASTYSFQKFAKHLTPEQDAFGYIPQINGYRHSSRDDPRNKDANRAAFLVVDKTLGHITLDVHEADDTNWEEFFEGRKEMVLQEEPPRRAFEDVPMSKTSPNRKLDTNCSYCAFKKECWPGVRSFAYANGPVHLTKVVKEPDVPEF